LRGSKPNCSGHAVKEFNCGSALRAALLAAIDEAPLSVGQKTSDEGHFSAPDPFQ